LYHETILYPCLLFRLRSGRIRRGR